MRNLICILTSFSFCVFGNSQLHNDPSEVWLGVIELPNDSLTRHVLNDLPGMICVLVPGEDSVVPNLIGDKVLKDAEKLPDLDATPTVFISSTITKEKAGKLGYLSFVSGALENGEEAKFSVIETAHTAAKDKEIDWVDFEGRVKKLKNDYPNLPEGTRFGVVRVASVLQVSYQTFFKVSKSAKIQGWGFSGGGKYLSQKSDESHEYKVGVALAYTGIDLEALVEDGETFLDLSEVLPDLDMIERAGEVNFIDSTQLSEFQ